MMVLMHHVIIEPLWSCHLLHLSLPLFHPSRLTLSASWTPKNLHNFAVENNHPLWFPWQPFHTTSHTKAVASHTTFQSSPIQSSRNPEMYSRGSLFCARMWRYRVEACVRVFSHHRRRTTQLCDDVSLFPSLTLPPPPKLFASHLPPATPLGAFCSTNSPTSPCFLCMELFVLLLGVAYSFFPFPIAVAALPPDAR